MQINKNSGYYKPIRKTGKTFPSKYPEDHLNIYDKDHYLTSPQAPASSRYGYPASAILKGIDDLLNLEDYNSEHDPEASTTPDTTTTLMLPLPTVFSPFDLATAIVQDIRNSNKNEGISH